MRVSIWDLDWYNKFSFMPNYKVQKISSYHKQQGDLINFIEDQYSITFDFDLMYIVKEKKVTPMPPTKFIDNPKVKLIGKDFDYFDNYYEIESIISMVRPDYSLYEVSDRNAYASANMVQLLHGTQFLPARQNAINYTMHSNNKTIIVDEMLWRASDETLQKCFDEIKQYRNVAFLHPISLKRVLQNNFIQQFINFNFLSGTLFKFKNDYGSEYDEVVDVINMMMELKQKNPSISLKGFPVKAVLYDH
jgi:hypothetical protein